MFEDEPLLFSRLVVPFPDRHEVIGQYAARALDERDSIVEAYRRWAPSNWQRSLDALAAFLSLTPTEQAHWRQMGGQIWRDNGGWAQWGARYAPHDQCVLPRAA